MDTPRTTTEPGKWNPLDFDCPHACDYCPETGKYSHKPQLRDDWRMIPSDYAIWVCEDTDLFHPAVPSSIINTVLARATQVNKGYIFCTKNPARYKEFLYDFPKWLYLATTIESDIDHKLSYAPPPLQRFKELMELKKLMRKPSYFGTQELCICIQPVMEFTPKFLELLVELAPNQISIGPEKDGYDTPQPSLEAVIELAVALQNRIPNVEVNVHGRGVKYNPGEIILPEIWNGARAAYAKKDPREHGEYYRLQEERD